MWCVGDDSSHLIYYITGKNARMGGTHSTANKYRVNFSTIMSRVIHEILKQFGVPYIMTLLARVSRTNTRVNASFHHRLDTNTTRK